MSERGIPCKNTSCQFSIHGNCHSDCARLDEANEIIYKLVGYIKVLIHGETINTGINEILSRSENFLEQDESFDPIENAKTKQAYNLLHFIDHTKCTKSMCGTRLCYLFNRTGDDYGVCRGTGKTCPCDGLVDPKKIELVKLGPEMVPHYKVTSRVMMNAFGFNEDDLSNPATQIPKNLQRRRVVAISLFEYSIADLEMINSCPDWDTIADVITDIGRFPINDNERRTYGSQP